VSIFRPRATSPTIRTKILAIAWVPSLVLLLVGVSVAAVFARQSLDQNKFTSSYMQVVQIASRFAAADQRERQLTAAYLLNPSRSRHDLDLQRKQTDAALAQLAPLSDTIIEAGSDSFATAVNRSKGSAFAFPELRQGVDSGALTLREATNAYSQTLNVFHAAFENLATSAATARIAAEYRLTGNLFQLADWRSESETFEQAAYSPTGLTDQEVGVFVDRVGGYHSLLASTIPRLPAAEQAQFKALMASTAWQQVMQVENNALQTGAAERGTSSTHHAGELPISQATWDAASAEVSRMLLNQYLQHVTYSTDLATKHAHDLLVRSLLTGAGLLLLSLVVFAIVTRMSNRLIRRLRRLQSETMELVSQRLPIIVERLGKGAQVDVDSELPPLDHGTDEIGQVADAFNRAQRTAVAAAAKEAETRAGTSKVFLNIAHRSQVVAHRQLKLLDQAERTQEDPDQLSLLFQLDHLTTRSRRNAENLIILGGGKPGRQWRNPVPLLDVVRSAVGEAETYTGITIEQMPKASVAGAAVADIIHLLAELVDNATRFSPPTARVEVRGNVAGRGIVIEIEDQGLGIERDQLEELNETLQKPPDFSVMALSDEPRLGLFVVRQLSVRHGVRVTLTESPAYGGIRAIVLIPLALITATVPTLPEMQSRSGPPRADLRETITGNVEVIGSVLPTRKTSRMISLAPNAPLPAQPPATAPPVPEPPGIDPPATEPPATEMPAPEPPAPERPAREAPTPWPSRVAREADWQTAEIPVIKADLLSNGNLTSRASGQDATKVAAAERDQRPALPKRTRQAHLAPQLLRDGRASVEPPPAPVESSVSAESARARLTAFQFGTRRGREDNPNFDS